MKETKGSTVLRKEKRNKFIEIVDDIVIQECFDIIFGLLDIGND